MDVPVLAIVAAVMVVIAVAVAAILQSRGGVDQPGDRGPYSSGSQTRGDFAAAGTTPDRERAADEIGEEGGDADGGAD